MKVRNFWLEKNASELESLARSLKENHPSLRSKVGKDPPQGCRTYPVLTFGLVDPDLKEKIGDIYPSSRRDSFVHFSLTPRFELIDYFGDFYFGTTMVPDYEPGGTIMGNTVYHPSEKISGIADELAALIGGEAVHHYSDCHGLFKCPSGPHESKYFHSRVRIKGIDSLKGVVQEIRENVETYLEFAWELDKYG